MTSCADAWPRRNNISITCRSLRDNPFSIGASMAVFYHMLEKLQLKNRPDFATASKDTQGGPRSLIL
jgi:hypothetical protein